jgi:hypothetical protein
MQLNTLLFFFEFTAYSKILNSVTELKDIFTNVASILLYESTQFIINTG